LNGKKKEGQKIGSRRDGSFNPTGSRVGEGKKRSMQRELQDKGKGNPWRNTGEGMDGSLLVLEKRKRIQKNQNTANGR